jgi:hypothetical protein
MALTGSQPIYSKTDKGAIKYFKVVPAIWLEFGSGDKTEEIDTTCKDEVTGKVASLKRTMPISTDEKGTRIESIYEDTELLSQGLEVLTAKFPNDRPIRKLLALASPQLNVLLKEQERPVEAVSREDAIKKFKIDYRKANPALTDEQLETFANQTYNMLHPAA